MLIALEEAQAAGVAGEVPVGAAIFDPATGAIVSRAANGPVGLSDPTAHAEIRRLVFGAQDEKGGAVAHGPRFFDQPTCHWRPSVTGGVLAEECASLLRRFFLARR